MPFFTEAAPQDLSHARGAAARRQVTISGLLSNLYDAYLTGRENTSEDSTDIAKQVWWRSLQAHAKSRLSPVEQRITALCKRACKAALAATLRLDVNGACGFFGIARAYAEKEELGVEGRLLCESDISAAESSLDSACRDFEQARCRLLRALVLDEELEFRFGYKLMHVHRIHLLARMVKNELAIAGFASAMRLAGSALFYLESGRNELSVPGCWEKKCLDALPPATLGFLTRQISIEIAAALADEPPDVVRNSLAPIVNRTKFWKQRAHWDALAHSWCELKMLYARREKREQYLQSCAVFLAQGRRRADALWYLAALDAARACYSLSLAPARSLCDRLAADLMFVETFPLSLRKAWSKALMQE